MQLLKAINQIAIIIFMSLRSQPNESKFLDAKSIPSKVFFNHFDAINKHIERGLASFIFNSIQYYNTLKICNDRIDLDKIKKILHNAWSTEFAISLSTEIDNDEYYKNSMHWIFPQVYYSIYLVMTAFHETQGVANDQHEKSIKIFGNAVKDNHYPEAISFYAKGGFGHFTFCNLSKAGNFKGDFNGLVTIKSEIDEQTQIAKFLNSTREKNAESKRNKLREQKDKKFLNKKGEFRKNFSKEHWDIIYTSIPETSIMNLLYRLRIKANYHDVDAFIHADIDFKNLHKTLSNIVYNLNLIHEAYIIKCIGREEYLKILNTFPMHLNGNLSKKRFEELN